MTSGLAWGEGETVGVWIKNTSASPVVVSVGGAQACSLEAPVYTPCVDKLTKLAKKTQCTTNNLKISCIANVPASGADVQLKRGDGGEYKVHAGKDAALYICIEPAGLTDCFGSKLH